MRITINEKEIEIKLTINALCRVEEKLRAVHGKSESFQEIIQRAQGVTEMTVIFWGSLLIHDQHISLFDAGLLAEDLGLKRLSEVIGELALEAFPDAKNDDEDPGEESQGNPESPADSQA